MHEISICQSIITQVENEMKNEELEYIREIHLQVGALSCIQPRFLEHVYGFLIVDSVLRNSSLKVEQIPTVAECDSCHQRFQVKNNRFICPSCESPASSILEGKEMKIVKLVIEAI